MEKPSSTAVLALIASWFTPTSLFLFINLVIGTLIITSRFTISSKRRHHRDSAASSATFARSPSLLDRVKSINHFSHYYHYYTEPTYAQVMNPPPLGRPPSLLQRLKSVNFSPNRYYNPDPAPETAGVNDDQPPPQPPPPSLLQRLKSVNFSPNRYYIPDPAPETAGVTDDLPPPPEPDCHVRRANSDSIPCGGEVPAKLPGKMRKSASHKSAFGHFEQDSTEDNAAELRQRSENGEYGEEVQIDAKADDFIGRFRQQLKLQKLESFMRYKEMLTRVHENETN